MVFSGMLRRVALVKNEVSEELRILPQPPSVASSAILVTLMKEALSSSETSVLSRATRRNIQEDAILNTQVVTKCKWRVTLADSSHIEPGQE
jgi:hypothetical protein